jgi:hypothetical protein
MRRLYCVCYKQKFSMQRSKCQVDVVPHYLALMQIGNTGVQFFYQMSGLGLLHLPPLRFHCVESEGFYRTKDIAT